MVRLLSRSQPRLEPRARVLTQSEMSDSEWSNGAFARRIARGEAPSVVPVGLAVGLGKSAVSPPPLMERAVDQEAERARAEEPEEPEAKRPRRSAAARACTQNKPVSYTGTASSEQAPAPRPKPTGRVLIIHANNKPYGKGPAGKTSDETAVGAAAVKAKASNRNFDFLCSDYEAMRDSGRPYSGNPKVNKLLPLPRPTYTEFINRAQRARMVDRLDFLFCAPDCPRPPRVDAAYEVVIWCGVSFRRFTRIWTPERSHFFTEAFQRRALATLCAAHRLRTQPPDGATATLGSLPDEILLEIIANSAERHEKSKEDYDDLDTVVSGARHLFLPAPGSSGVRDHLFDACFGLYPPAR